MILQFIMTTKTAFISGDQKSIVVFAQIITQSLKNALSFQLAPIEGEILFVFGKKQKD